MKNYKLMKNISLKIMAFVFAFVLWIIVVNVDDPVETTTFRNVSVAVQNADVVTGKGNVYQILDDTQTVNVVVSAKRSALSKMTSSSLVASADMTEMQMNSLVPITVTIPGYDEKYAAKAVPGNLKIKVEAHTRRVFPLTVSASGTPRDGYVVGTMPTNPEKIQLGGAESLVDSIDKVVAKVDVAGLSKTTVLPAELVYYDGNGNPVDQTLLTNNLGSDGVTVTVQMLNTKNVSLNFAVSGTPKAGYVFNGLSSEPKKIQICGTKEALAGFNAIDIPASELDITDITDKLEKTVDILPLLPEGIELVDETANNVIVSIAIEEEGIRTIELPVESIIINNLQEDLQVSFDANADIELQFRGTQEMLDKLDVKKAASINLKEFTKPGTLEVPVNINLGNDTNITLTQNPKVKVTLSKKTSNE